MDGQNLSYALIQVAHNAGAVAVAGSAAFGYWLRGGEADLRPPLARVVAFGWLLQTVSGAGFGAVSYAYYGQFPDLHGIAVAALIIKVLCAVCGFALAATYMVRAEQWPMARRHLAWHALAALAATALMAAAFLRWFS